MNQTAPSTPTTPAWHALAAHAVLEIIETSHNQGLTETEAQRRSKQS